MQIRSLIGCAAVSVSMLASGQTGSGASPKAPDGPEGQVRMERRGGNIMFHREMGKWWKNSDTAQKLQLSDNQIQQLDQIFYEHRLKLIDYGANMEKEDLKLQTLLDADVPNEGQVGSQVDQVLSARGKLEREYTMMNLDLRKVLSVEQWRQLKTIRQQRGGHGDHIMFFQKTLPGPGGPGEPPLPPAPPGLDE